MRLNRAGPSLFCLPALTLGLLTLPPPSAIGQTGLVPAPAVPPSYPAPTYGSPPTAGTAYGSGGATYTFTDLENRTVLVNGEPAVEGVAYSSDDIVEVIADAGGSGSFTVLQHEGPWVAAIATPLVSQGVTTIDGMWADFTAIWIDECQAPPIPRTLALPGVGFTAIWIDE